MFPSPLSDPNVHPSDAVQRALAQHTTLVAAARSLGISRDALIRRMRRYGLRPQLAKRVTTPERKAAQNAWHKARRKERASSGACADCGAPDTVCPFDGSSRCDPCRSRRRTRRRERAAVTS